MSALIDPCTMGRNIFLRDKNSNFSFSILVILCAIFVLNGSFALYTLILTIVLRGGLICNTINCVFTSDCGRESQ